MTTNPTHNTKTAVAKRLAPWLAAAAALLLVLMPAIRGDGAGGGREEVAAYDLTGFGRLPVSADGRIKPMDTVARNTLVSVSGRQTFEYEGQRLPAVRFLIDLMARPQVAQHYEVIRIDHPQVLTLVGQPQDQVGRFSLATVQPHWPKVAEQAEAALQLEPRSRDAYQRAVLDLYRRVDLLLGLSQMHHPYVVPPLQEGEAWRAFSEALVAGMHAGAARPDGSIDPTRLHPAVAAVTGVMSAYNDRDPGKFNQALAGYQHLLLARLPEATGQVRHEVAFNRLQPFYGAMAAYVLAFLLGCGALVLRPAADGVTHAGEQRVTRAPGTPGWPEVLRRCAVAVLLVAFVVHTLGIAARIYLQGRPPVTNLYSSAIFVGWAAVLMGLGLEKLFKLGLAGLCTAVAGFGTLVVAHNLGNDGDTMQMMQAVLDSNFWLATHVVAITLGYAAMFLAGMLGAAYIVFGVFTSMLSGDKARSLIRMVYGITCFALLFSFVGTVLGGIWADQSWGRFWGWDPKENGAALVVLMGALLLHARWGGLIRERGIAVLAVGGNIVTAWSWFGTNMLGVGLHSYGFMESAVFWLMAFVVSQLAVMGLGLLPTGWWKSNRREESDERIGTTMPVATAG
ncbi:MAG: cytochrome c biogenesis protein [Phycisphaerae bacterium]